MTENHTSSFTLAKNLTNSVKFFTVSHSAFGGIALSEHQRVIRQNIQKHTGG